MESNNGTLALDMSCFTSYSHKIYLTATQRQILVVFDIVVMALNLLANSFALIVLLMSRPCQNTSYMLLFYLSLSDCFSGLLAQSLYAILIGQYFDQSYCSFEIIGQFFAVLLPHTSGYAIAAIAFDRYARMRFSNRYPVVVTKQKIIVVCSVITFISLSEALLYAFCSKFNFFNISKNFVHVIRHFCFCFCCCYIFTHCESCKVSSEQCDKSNIIAKCKQNYDNIGLKDSGSYCIFIWNLHSSSLHGIYKQSKERFETMVKFCITCWLFNNIC